MYMSHISRLLKYLTDNNILYDKQFGFCNSRSSEHAVIELLDTLLFEVLGQFPNKKIWSNNKIKLNTVIKLMYLQIRHPQSTFPRFVSLVLN